MIVDQESFQGVLNYLTRYRDPIAVDTETTGLRLYQGDTLRGISVAAGDDTWYFPVTHPVSANIPPATIRALCRALNEVFTVWHNGPFDWAALAPYGLAQPEVGQFADTLVLDWMLDENNSHALKDIGEREFGIEAKREQRELRQLMAGKTVDTCYRERRAVVGRSEPAALSHEYAIKAAEASKKGWGDLTATDIAPYAERDAWLTGHVFDHHMTTISCNIGSEVDVSPDLRREHAVDAFVYRLTRTGMRVNEERAALALVAAEAEWAQLAAGFGDVNLAQPADVATLLYDTWGLPCSRRTPKGNRSTDRLALEWLSYDPRVAGLLRYRHLGKEITAYYRPLISKLGPDSRVHPSWNAFRTVTGRFSCSGPNLMQIPRENTSATIRHCFEAEPGTELSEFDLSQAEPRVMAALASEEALLGVFRAGDDYYTALASEMSCDRQTAKQVALSSGYGVGARKLALILATGSQPTSKDVTFARQALARYWATVPKVARLRSALEVHARRHGYVPVIPYDGRYRRLKLDYARKALNAVIQGAVAELMKDVLLDLEETLDSYGRIVAQVHDSVVIEHEPGAGRTIHALLQRITDTRNPYNVALPWAWKEWSP